ncbi:hypothetical protein BCEP4_880012 [Burkholderia cepacia]|nr:hypothetical protein BCEP4_880012 [Burkholderia cepacia]
MAAKAPPDLPMHGMPRMLYMDSGPIARSEVFQRVMRYLGIEVRSHLPAGKDTRQQHRARATGKVERPFRTVKEVHETLYHFQKPQNEAEANAWLHNFLIRSNAMDHRSGAQSRIDYWLQHLPGEGIRAYAIGCAFVRSPASTIGGRSVSMPVCRSKGFATRLIQILRTKRSHCGGGCSTRSYSSSMATNATDRICRSMAPSR